MVATDNESLLTIAARGAIEMLEDIADAVEAEFEVPFGREKVTIRMVRQQIRLAIPEIFEEPDGGATVQREGDPEAIAQLEQWAADGGHQDGETVICELCRHINVVLHERFGDAF